MARYDAICRALNMARGHALQDGDRFVDSEAISSCLAVAMLRKKQSLPAADWRKAVEDAFDGKAFSGVTKFSEAVRTNARGWVSVTAGEGKAEKTVFAIWLDSEVQLINVPGIQGSYVARKTPAEAAIDPGLAALFEKVITSRVRRAEAQRTVNPLFAENLLAFMRAQFVIILALPRYDDGTDEKGRYLERKFDDLLAAFDEAVFKPALASNAGCDRVIAQINSGRASVQRGDPVRVWRSATGTFDPLEQGCYVRDFTSGRDRFEIVRRAQLGAKDQSFEWVDAGFVFPVNTSVGNALLCIHEKLPAFSSNGKYRELLIQAAAALDIDARFQERSSKK